MSASIPLFRVTMNSAAAIQAVSKVLSPKEDGSYYVGEGPVGQEFETKFQSLIGSKVTPLLTNSCTSALILALKTIGVGPGDKVISSPTNCTAGSHSIIQTGAEIIWADVNPNTGLIDPISVARSITPEVKAIMAVDWGGAACDYEALKKHELPVIQDAAHCLKLRSDPAQRGDYTAWSFGPIKHLCMGDGGALLVPDQSTLAWKEDSFILFTLYERAKLLRWFGISREGSDSFRCAAKIDLPGGKFHANDIQASIGLANMKYAVQCVEKARENALYYTKIFRGIDGLVLPEVHPENSWWLYTLVLKENRDEFMKYMISKGVGCSMVHARNDFHPVFKNISSVNPLGLDGVDYFDSHQCSIPVGHWVTKEQREYIANLVLAYFGV